MKKYFIYIFSLLLIFVIALIIFVGYLGHKSLISIPQSHYENNMPEAEKLDELMRKELNDYFEISDNKNINILYEVIGEPRVTGIAFPKLYIWIIIEEKNKIQKE